MADFLTRLAERSLMLADVVRPATAPLFAPARERGTGELSELRGEGEPDPTGGLLEILEPSARDISQPGKRPPALPLGPPFHSSDEARGAAPGPSKHSRASLSGGAAGREGDGGLANEPLMENGPSGDSTGGPSNRESGSRPDSIEPSSRALHPSRETASERTRSRTPEGPDSTPARQAAVPGTVRPREIYLADKSADVSGNSREARQEASRPAPVIKVSIGRIEVRALAPQAPPAPRARPSSSGPSLTLDQYLKQRDEGKR